MPAQAKQLRPPVPQEAFVPPVSHVPAEVQHPSGHVDGLQVLPASAPLLEPEPPPELLPEPLLDPDPPPLLDPELLPAGTQLPEVQINSQSQAALLQQAWPMAPQAAGAPASPPVGP